MYDLVWLMKKKGRPDVQPAPDNWNEHISKRIQDHWPR
jgi:hypothetical protein